MKATGRAIVFSLVAAIAYTLAYYFDWPLFQYYFREGRFGFGSESEPSILWYGWIATAVIAGLAAALLTPPRLAARLSADLIWLVPVATIVAAILYEQRWFALLFNAQSALGN